MFGLMRPAKSCGKPKTAQRMHYCGTCKTIGQQYGQKSRLLLNYDAVFLAELLSALSAENLQEWHSSLQAVNQCFKTPSQSEKMPNSLQYAAAANVFLAELKLDDNLKDRAKAKYKFMRWFLSSNFKKASARLENWGLDTDFFWQQVAAQADLETSKNADFHTIGESLQRYSQTTAEMTAALFARGAWAIERTDLEADLYQIGWAFGELVYALDAFEDLENDIFYQQFNPLALFFEVENGSISASNLEQVRAIILAKQQNLSELFAALPIEKEQVELFQSRLGSNIALRLYREREIPQTLAQTLAFRWQNARGAAAQLICAPDSWGKKLQYHFVSVLFFILPTLSVEFSQQKNQMWAGLGLLTAILASVGLAKSVLPKKKKRSIWQRIGSLFPKKGKKACEDCDDCCEDCCEDCETCGIVLLVILGVALVIGGIAAAIAGGQTFINFLLGLGALIAFPLLIGGGALLGEWISDWSDSIASNRSRKKYARKRKQDEIIKGQTEAFFAQNASRPEIKTLQDGVQYEVLTKGNPQRPREKYCLFDIKIADNPAMKNPKLEQMSMQEAAQSHFFSPETEWLPYYMLLLPNIGSKYKFYIPADLSNNFDYFEESSETGMYVEIEVLGKYSASLPQETYQRYKQTKIFFAKNAARPEIRLLEDGSQYEILNEGDAQRPKQEHSVFEIKIANNPSMDGAKTVEKTIPNIIKADIYSERLLKTLIEKLPNIGSKGKFYVAPDTAQEYYGKTYEDIGMYLEIEVLDRQDPEIFTTPSGLRYRIINKGNPAKPVTEGQIVEQGINCDAESQKCEQTFKAPIWFKDDSQERQGYDLMKYQGAYYYFYLPNQPLNKPSFTIKILENQ